MGKPHLRFVDGRPVEVEPALKLSPAALKAREKHGRPFASELGSEYKPHEVPVLTRWMQAGGAKASK